jgi:UDP-glucose 4-epimerase
MRLREVAVIGANGFIGKHLVRALERQDGLHVTLFGRSAVSSHGKKMPYHQLNLSDLSGDISHFKNTEIVYYLASDSIPSSSWNDPVFDIEKNLLPFIHFLDRLSKLNLKKVVFVSSAGTIYGQSNEKLTEDSDKKPFSPYGINKLAMENYLSYFEARYGVKHDIFRVSNVYGEGQDTSKGLGIINTFLERILTDKSVTIYGNGQNIRNYIHVGDVGELLSLSVTNGKNSNIINLASDDNISINQLIEVIKQVVTEDFGVKYVESRQSDNPAISLDNTKLKNTYIDFRFIPLKEGIEKTYSFIKQKLEQKTN